MGDMLMEFHQSLSIRLTLGTGRPCSTFLEGCNPSRLWVGDRRLITFLGNSYA